MIVKVPIYCELIGKVDSDVLQAEIAELQEQFYFILRKRKIKMTVHFGPDEFNLSDFGIDDIRILSTEEALDSLRVKK